MSSARMIKIHCLIRVSQSAISGKSRNGGAVGVGNFDGVTTFVGSGIGAGTIGYSINGRSVEVVMPAMNIWFSFRCCQLPFTTTHVLLNFQKCPEMSGNVRFPRGVGRTGGGAEGFWQWILRAYRTSPSEPRKLPKKVKRPL
jgi:hypothetical protein